MLTLVTGGAASGKSAYAEKQILSTQGTPRLYVATMLAQDTESRARVERHRALRKGKGFHTIECPFALDKLNIPKGATVLLECMSNLLANECFYPEGAGKEAETRILQGVAKICTSAQDVVIVTNDIFSDGNPYDTSTLEYIAMLARVNAALAQSADRVVEVVCGIPIVHKGRPEGCV